MTPAEPTIERHDSGDLSEADLRAINRLRNAWRAEWLPDDPPTPPEITIASWRNLPAHERMRVWMVRDGDDLAALATAEWEPEGKDNLHLLPVGITVLAPHRRRGIGRALLRELVACADELERTVLMSGAVDRVPAGAAFAQAFGATMGQEQRISHLVMAGLDRGLVERWVNEGPGRAPGYELVFIDGDIPDELMDQALAAFHVMNTAPRDDLDMEDWVMTAEHIRAWERMRAAAGGHAWTLFARHRDSGDLVGFTEVAWNPKVEGIVQQLGTAVDPAHRGHALGKWMKAEMLRRLLADGPPVREIRTGNAESNDAMLGINVALGFRPFFADNVWQAKVDDVRAALA